MKIRPMLVAFAVALLILTACSKGRSSAAPSTQTSGPTAALASHSPGPEKTPSPVPVQSPVPVESNPPGDIPDNTAFVPYRSSQGGFAISVPEGWARATGRGSVSFTDKLNTIAVTWRPAASAPTIATATSTEVPRLRKTQLAFRLGKVSNAPLPAGPTVLVTYRVNSTPSAVTGKQYRLEVLRYEVYRKGEEAVITLSSPVGADNVDPWRIVTDSFRWA